MSEAPKVTIDPTYCKKCYLCVEFCPKKALKGGEDGVPVVDEETCIQCGLCEMYCPDFAIKVRPKEKNEVPSAA